MALYRYGLYSYGLQPIDTAHIIEIPDKLHHLAEKIASNYRANNLFSIGACRRRPPRGQDGSEGGIEKVVDEARVLGDTGRPSVLAVGMLRDIS